MIRGVHGGFCNIIQKVTVSTGKNYATAQIAPLQRAALQERCILVDNLDRAIGEATKKVCHEVNADGSLLLHRAFSVFLFNTKGELLLQKRSGNKVGIYVCNIYYNYIQVFHSVFEYLYILYIESLFSGNPG